MLFLQSAEKAAARARGTVFLLVLSVCLGCGTSRSLRTEYSDPGRFEYRHALAGLEGVVVGAPHGRSDLHSNALALALSDHTGAGLVIAYGFKSKRLGVAQPIVRSHPSFFAKSSSAPRGSVFREYREILGKAARGELRLYVGVHRSTQKQVAGRIEVATGGLTFEEAEALKRAYIRIRDRTASKRVAPVLDMAIEPLDRISWKVSGVKHHGVLLVAKKGLNLRIPPLGEPAETLYAAVLSRWVDEAIRIIRDDSARLPQIEVHLLDLGRFEVIPSRKGITGVVMGAPHGTFDEHTAEMVKRLSLRTGMTAVVAKGFTPTEASGWRINVNRPTEKTFPAQAGELHSLRAARVYKTFKDLVTDASGDALRVYVDVHQYGPGTSIQVATTGVSSREATTIKRRFYDIRDRVLRLKPGLAAAEMLVEPLDQLEIRAWPAKKEGILRLAAKSLHFELPMIPVMSTLAAREAYTGILAELITETVPFLLDSLTEPGLNRQ